MLWWASNFLNHTALSDSMSFLRFKLSFYVIIFFIDAFVLNIVTLHSFRKRRYLLFKKTLHGSAQFGLTWHKNRCFVLFSSLFSHLGQIPRIIFFFSFSLFKVLESYLTLQKTMFSICHMTTTKINIEDDLLSVGWQDFLSKYWFIVSKTKRRIQYNKLSLDIRIRTVWQKTNWIFIVLSKPIVVNLSYSPV